MGVENIWALEQKSNSRLHNTAKWEDSWFLLFNKYYSTGLCKPAVR